MDRKTLNIYETVTLSWLLGDKRILLERGPGRAQRQSEQARLLLDRGGWDRRPEVGSGQHNKVGSPVPAKALPHAAVRRLEELTWT